MEQFIAQALILCVLLSSSRVAAQGCEDLLPPANIFNASAWLSCINQVEPAVPVSTPDDLYDLLSNLDMPDATAVITSTQMWGERAA